MTATELEADNAKLREQVERLRTQLADMTESVGRVEERCTKTFEVGKRWMAKAARFEAENAKLRELVGMIGNVCDGTSEVCEYCKNYSATNDECMMLKQMRELGVEVD